MNAVWTINERPARDLGISALDFTWLNAGTSTAVLKCVDDGAAAAAWPHKTKVVIARDGVPHFIGWVTEVLPVSAARDEGPQVVVSDAMWWLEQIVFTRSLVASGRVYDVSSFSLFVNSNNQQIGLAEQMREILARAAALSGSAFSVGSVSSDITLIPEPDAIEGETCLSAARRVMRWTPANCLTCDISTGQPRIHWRAAGSRSATFARGQSPLTQAEVSTANGMACTGVVLRFSDPVTGSAVAPQCEYTTGPSVRSPGVVLSTLPTSQWRTTSYLWPAKVLAGIRGFAWQGRLTLEGKYLDVKPGDKVKLSGRDEWRGCEAIAQAVSHNAARDITQITVGPPAHIGIRELADLYWFANQMTKEAEAEPVRRSFEVWVQDEPIWGKVIRVAPGHVSDGKTEDVPLLLGARLDAKTAPFFRTKLVETQEIYLRVLWKPDVQIFSGQDPLGITVQAFFPLSTGEFTFCEITNWRRDNRAPFVSQAFGSSYPGEFFFKLATVQINFGKVSVTQHKQGDMLLNFIAPNNLYVMSNG